MKRNKYNARKVIIDGIKFDSQKEGLRYLELNMMQKAGVISQLELQPRYDIHVSGKRICFYKADFRYIENETQVVEDVKGMKTPVYNLKKKLVQACHGITIMEV